jgi:hypothetical protein
VGGGFGELAQLAAIDKGFEDVLLDGEIAKPTFAYVSMRPHQGRWCYGKTPMQTFIDSVPLAEEKLIA